MACGCDDSGCVVGNAVVIGATRTQPELKRHPNESITAVRTQLWYLSISLGRGPLDTWVALRPGLVSAEPITPSAARESVPELLPCDRAAL